MNKHLLVAGSIFGFLGVLIGAFGAHALEKSMETAAQATFETGVKYQIYHALLLLILPSLPLSARSKKILCWMIIVGIVFFSGSIYGLATNNLFAFDFKKMVLLTPLGGTILIATWGLLIYRLIKPTKG